MNSVIKATECSAIRVNIFCHCWPPLPKSPTGVGHVPGWTSLFWPLALSPLSPHWWDGCTTSHFLPWASFAGSIPPHPTVCVCREEENLDQGWVSPSGRHQRGQQQLKQQHPRYFLGKTQDPSGERWKKKGNLAASKKTRTSGVMKNPVGVRLRESEGSKWRSWGRNQSLLFKTLKFFITSILIL